MSQATATANGVRSLTDQQRRMYRGAIYMFILGEAMIFVTLFSSRFLLAGMGHPANVDYTLGLTITALLVVSVIPVFAGLARVRAGNSGAGMLRLAALLGIAALALIIYDWTGLTFDITSRYGENYVLSTGYHALHIILGLISLLVVAAGDSRREFSPAAHWQVEAAAVFWSFVVFSWIVLYAVFFVF